jgi:predicted phosphatase
MTITKSESINPVDVDGTLIIHTKAYIKPSERVYIVDPVTGKEIVVRVNRPMVRLLKEESQRGSYVLVWSRGGWEWARNVIQALDLVPYVNHIMSKPLRYMDDSPVKKWMKDRVFIGPDEAYKEMK